MAEREVRIRFTGESAVLKGSAADVRKIFQNMVDDTDDARTAGQKLADAQAQVAAKMRAEMAEVSSAADVLADSLGPEMVRAIEASGQSVEDVVQKWRKLGLTYDDIKMDSDQIAAGMREMDDAARMSTGAVGDGFKKVADGSDRARSNMANFAGNAISELPLVSGAIGPLNVGLGQMTEALAEGDVSMKKFVTTGLGMAAAALVLDGIVDTMNDVDETKIWEADTVDAWTKAIREGDTALGALKATATSTGKIMGEVWGPTGQVLADITPFLDSAGVSFDQFLWSVDNGIKGQEAMAAALQASGADMLTQNIIVGAVIRHQDMAAKAAANAAAFQRVFGSSLDDTGDSAAGAAENVDKYTRGVGGATVQTDKARIAAEKLQGLFDEMDAEDAALNVADQFDQLRQAAEAAYTAQTDGADDAEQKQRDFLRTQNETNRSVYEYLTTVLGLPAERATAVMARIDTMSLDAAERAIAKLVAPRTVSIMPVVGTGGNVGGVVVTPRDEALSRSAGAPIIVESTVVLQLEGQTLQAITTWQENQRRGTR